MSVYDNSGPFEYFSEKRFLGKSKENPDCSTMHVDMFSIANGKSDTKAQVHYPDMIFRQIVLLYGLEMSYIIGRFWKLFASS